jgi:hypothetical protein
MWRTMSATVLHRLNSPAGATFVRALRRLLLATLLTAAAAIAHAQDALRVQELRQEINELQRTVRDQARRIERLEQQLGQSKIAVSPGPPRSPVPPTPAGSDKWLVPGNWEKLRTGMTEQQVLDTIGYPTTSRGTAASKTLFYTVQVGANGFLSGRVLITDREVREIQKPILR